MIKKSVISFCLLMVFLFNFVLPISAVNPQSPPLSIIPVPTIEYSLPYPGILPDNPLYSIKVLRDRILVIFTRDPVKKVHLNLLLSDKRIVMGQILWEKGDKELSISTITKAEKYLLNSSLELVNLSKKNNLPPGLSDKVNLAARKHTQIIDKIISETTDETAKQRLTDALGVTHQAVQQIASFK